MPFFTSSKPKYSSLESGELPEYDELRLGMAEKPKVQVKLSWLVTALLACIPLTTVATLLVNQRFTAAPAQVVCSSPPIRREWRTLSRSDRAHYIDAVKCLTQRPSVLRDNGTAYDDFPWVHQATHPTAHKSAPFLPWHRYYIHSYETALREQCGFNAALPYWDWSLDADNFEGAPVWDAAYGFGGDGAGEETVGNGRCVEDGPFAGTNALYYADEEKPHCLSRGWARGNELRELTNLVRKEDLDSLVERDADFTSFAPELERRAHTFISRSIGGDFSKYTGPYDPVFFLHHANLDRLWAEWQAKHDAGAYAGKASMYSDAPASKADMLDIGGLMGSVPVSDVMSTTEGMFCYRY